MHLQLEIKMETINTSYLLKISFICHLKTMKKKLRPITLRRNTLSELQHL